MGVKECRIHLDKGQAEFYPGDTVSGQIKYTLDSDTLINAIILSVKGRASCRWKYKNKDRETKTRSDYEKVFTQKLELLDDKSLDGKAPLAAGSYTHNFQFLLPEDIPHSYRKGPSFISYYLKLAFVRPDFWKRDRVFKTGIQVGAYVDISSAIYRTARNPSTHVLTRPVYKLFTKDGDLITKISLPKSVYLPGELIHVEYEVENNTSMSLPGIRTNFVQKVTYSVRNSNWNKVFYNDVIKAPKSGAIDRAQQKRISCEVSIPADTVPVLLHCAIIRIEYLLLVTVRLPGMRINSRLEIPVVIGTTEGSTERQSDSKPCTSSEPQLAPPEDAPPGYSPPEYADSAPPEYTSHSHSPTGHSPPGYSPPGFSSPGYSSPGYNEPPPTYWEAMQPEEANDK